MNKYRTHTCSELTKDNSGKDVVLSGWINKKRDHGNLLFIDLRDNYGMTQCIIDKSNDNFKSLEKIQLESVIKINGKVVERTKETINTDLQTGEIEVNINSFEVLGTCKELPMPVFSDQEYAEEIRLKYRFLDLRRKKIHDNIILRSKVISFIRSEMSKLGFLEFQTPILTSSSPEGARDFLVPSRLNPGKFYVSRNRGAYQSTPQRLGGDDMSHRPYLLSGLASVALIASVTAPPAYAQQLYDFDIPAQDLGSALRTFARTSGVQVIFDGGALRGKRSARYRQRAAPEAALQTILRGTGMSFRRDGGIYVIVPADTPVRPTASAAPPTTPAPAPAVPQDAVAEEDAEVIVTAQKRAERIIDVPIAMTALSGSALDDRKIEGGSELLRAVPNVTFSKSNFSMYNFSIRGIGTKAISASSDPPSLDLNDNGP